MNVYCSTCHRQHEVRRQAAPASRGATWRDALEALAGLAVLGLIGFSFWLWLAIAAAAQS